MSTTIYRAAAFLVSIAAGRCLLLVRAWAPTCVDFGRDMGSPEAAVLVNLVLRLVFGPQHSVMAWPGFNHFWTLVVPKEMERSLYVLIASAMQLALCIDAR